MYLVCDNIYRDRLQLFLFIAIQDTEYTKKRNIYYEFKNEIFITDLRANALDTTLYIYFSQRCSIPWSSSVRRAVSCWRTSMNSQIKLAVANTEAQARKALQALKNPGQARLRLPLHLRPFLVDIFQYSERSSLLSDSNS